MAHHLLIVVDRTTFGAFYNITLETYGYILHLFEHTMVLITLDPKRVDFRWVEQPAHTSKHVLWQLNTWNRI